MLCRSPNYFRKGQLSFKWLSLSTIICIAGAKSTDFPTDCCVASRRADPICSIYVIALDNYFPSFVNFYHKICELLKTLLSITFKVNIVNYQLSELVYLGRFIMCSYYLQLVINAGFMVGCGTLFMLFLVSSSVIIIGISNWFAQESDIVVFCQFDGFFCYHYNVS